MAAFGEEAADWLTDDPAEPYVPLSGNGSPWRGELLPPVALEDAAEHPDEDAWDQLGMEGVDWVPVPVPVPVPGADAAVDTPELPVSSRRGA